METRFEYDSQADALYIHFGRTPKQVTPHRLVEDADLAEDIAMDFDEDEKIAGIEILGASRYFREKELLEDAHRLSTLPDKAAFKQPILI